MEGREFRNWLELPQELTSSILHRVGAIEILENAQKVCRSWRGVCGEPSMWQKIDMSNIEDIERLKFGLGIMCRHAIDRSQGGLVDINIRKFGTNDLLQYIADSSCHLRRLRLARCDSITGKGVAEAVVKLPLLEDLEVSYCSLSSDSLKVIGRSCPHLKTLKVNKQSYWRPGFEGDEDALAIAENMPGLRHLELSGHGLTESGLNAILDKCLHLEHLDTSNFNSKFSGDLEKRCYERIKVVKLHPTIHYPFMFIDPIDPKIVKIISLGII